MRSRLTRRIRVRLSASSPGSSPASRIRCNTKASTGLRTQSSLPAAGNSGWVGTMYAQCGWYSPPASIQRRSASISSLERRFPVSDGGIRSAGSAWATRRTSSLASASPGTMAGPPFRCSFVAPARMCRLRSASLAAESGPWQAKQLLARIGRISRLNAGSCAAVSDMNGTDAATSIAAPVKRRSRCRLAIVVRSGRRLGEPGTEIQAHLWQILTQDFPVVLRNGRAPQK